MNNKDRRSELMTNLQTLANTLVTDPSSLQAYVKKWSNGFHSYSLHNTLLILWQKKDATFCASYTTWKEHYRFVRPGEKGLMIFAPRFHKEQDPKTNEETTTMYFVVVHTFDVSQTDGKPLTIGHSDKVTGAWNYNLLDIASLFQIPVQFRDGIEGGSTDGKNIWISPRENNNAMIAAYFHELAHCKMHFGNERATTDKETRELEAEAVSYIVSLALGIENPTSCLYISHWKGDSHKLNKSGLRILSTAESIIRTIDKSKEAQHEA